MKTTEVRLAWAEHVLALDRWRQCTRVVPGLHVAIVDDTGTERTFTRVDTDSGTLWYVDAVGRTVRERGKFTVVISSKFKSFYQG